MNKKEKKEMRKIELFKEITLKTGLPLEAVENVYKAFKDIIIEKLQKEEKVILTGFGKFSTTKLKAREGVNPKTKEKMKIKETLAPRFSFGKAMKDAIKGRTKK